MKSVRTFIGRVLNRTLVVTNASRSAIGNGWLLLKIVKQFQGCKLVPERLRSGGKLLLLAGRSVQQRVLFRGIDGQPVLACHGPVHELDLDIGAHILDVAVAPPFERKSRHLTALLRRALITAARGMRINLVGRPELDIDHAPIGLPSRNSGCETFVGVSDPPVVFLFEFVLFGIWRRIAP